MALTEVLRDLAIQKAPKQAVLVDALTEEAPMLAGLPLEASSHGLSNVYEQVTDIDAGDIVDLDEALPTINANSELKQVDLSVFGGKITVGEDKAKKFGGASAYFAKKMPKILRQTGNDMEAGLFYNNFRAHTIANNKDVSAGGSSDTNYSILCVHFVPGEVTGLYDEEGFGNGKVFDMSPINGGNIYEDSNGVLVYGMRMKTYFGIQLANSRYVSSIVNNDIANDDPAGTRTFATETMLDDMVTNARGAVGTTFIYCHPKVKSYIGSIYKLDKMRLQNADREVNSIVDAWNGIPIIGTYNVLDGTEADVA